MHLIRYAVDHGAFVPVFGGGIYYLVTRAEQARHVINDARRERP